MEVKNINSIQRWIPIEKILDRGIIKINKKKYIKILKVNPINYNLKTQLEKETILNSYKIFLKTYSNDLQILIQSKRENLNSHIENIKNNSQNEKNKIIKDYSKKYIEYLSEKNIKNKSSSKNMYLIVKNNLENVEEIVIQELNEKYFKIKESLNRCGNLVRELTKDEVLEILNSFLNLGRYLKSKE